jgi:hypothetical protein
MAIKEINMNNKQSSLTEYEKKQAQIKKLLKQIEAGLEKHDRAASGQGGHHWGHVGDLASIAVELQDISDRLHHKGEYAEVVKTW